MLSKNKRSALVNEKREWIAKEFSWRNSYGHHHFFLLSPEGKWIDFAENPCYGALLKPRKGTDFISVEWEKGKILSYDQREYFEWWINESFAADAFLDKNVERILTHGMLLDCSYPAQYVITAGEGIRYIQEYPSRVELWNVFSKYINKDAASILVHCLCQTNNGNYIKQLDMGHAWFNNTITEIGFQRIVNHDHALFEQFPSMSENTNFAGTMSIWEGGYADRQTGGRFNSMLNMPKTEKIQERYGWRQDIIDAYPKENIRNWLTDIVDLNMLGKVKKKYEEAA